MIKQLAARLTFALCFAFAAVAMVASGPPLQAQTASDVWELLDQNPERLKSRCERGRAMECLAYAEMVESSPDPAIKQTHVDWKRRACDLNLGLACTWYAKAASEGRGLDPEIAEYFYSGCLLGDQEGCRYAVAYAYGDNPAITGRERRIEIGQNACYWGYETGCILLEELGVNPQMELDPRAMDAQDMRFYAEQTQDYVAIASEITRRHRFGIRQRSRHREFGPLLAVIIAQMGPETYARLAPSAVRSIGQYEYWPAGSNPIASRIASREYEKLRSAERQAEEERIAREAEYWASVRAQQAQQRAQSSWNIGNLRSYGSSGATSQYRPPSPPQRAQYCYWASTGSGVGGGRYRTCRYL